MTTTLSIEHDVAFYQLRGYTFHTIVDSLLNHLSYQKIRMMKTQNLQKMLIRFGQNHADEDIRKFFNEYRHHSQWLAGACKQLCKILADINANHVDTEFQLPAFQLSNGYELRCGVPDLVFTFQNRNATGVGVLELKTGIKPIKKNSAKITRYLAGLWSVLDKQGRAHELQELYWLSFSTFKIDKRTGIVGPSDGPSVRLRRVPFDTEILNESLFLRYGITLQDLKNPA